MALKEARMDILGLLAKAKAKAKAKVARPADLIGRRVPKIFMTM